VKRNLRTEFHPCGTTAMMPLGLGGVVDSSLKVYGTENLRVVDAGIMPLIPGAHLQAAVYAVAEKVSSWLLFNLPTWEQNEYGLTYNMCRLRISSSRRTRVAVQDTSTMLVKGLGLISFKKISSPRVAP